MTTMRYAYTVQRAFSSAYATAAATAASPSTRNILKLSADLPYILSRPDWRNNLSLDRLAKSLTPTLLSHLLLSLPLKPSAAVAFFDWIGHQPSFQHTVTTHAALLRSLLRSTLPSPLEKFAISTIRSCHCRDELLAVLDLLLLAAERSCSIRCFNNLLMALRTFSMIDEMESVFEIISKGKCVLQTITTCGIEP
ncbi:hypothetical protein KFK09_006037 [Dendrobium nobile]|uniref:Pentatricopeptide repeat-containing protein n=1 Tax=Dendrobium nobile TaxID=94219 RepID=A0A8T3BSI0_DENNO|nr:hypothetical protein KFK09_006037 [Dendrobium nobile]